MDETMDFIKFLQACVTPVALTSGIGLLLLTVTNRFGRSIDRIRHLVAELDSGLPSNREVNINEIRILNWRSRLLRSPISAIIIRIIASSLIIPLLFLMILFDYDLKIYGYIFFVLSILALFVSSIYFFLDVILSLKVLHLEAREYI